MKTRLGFAYLYMSTIGLADEVIRTDGIELTRKIHAFIVESAAAEANSEMAEYVGYVEFSRSEFTMLPIPGGEFMQGSPDKEPKRKADEGPQRKVKIEPFWMGKHEVTWDEFEPFMNTDDARNREGVRQSWEPHDPLYELVSAPTTPYIEMDFGMGWDGFPAVAMTQHGALKYCQWLSAQTGHFYRLPTESEWEYACRAGTETAYSWGDDAKLASKYAWFYDNSKDAYQKVGTKLPNPWGLHDMHGNVLEWTLDAYDENFYRTNSPFNSPGKDLYPRVSRGGSWYDYVEDLRSASRLGSHPGWKRVDPQLPKSIWHLPNAPWLGFRLVRPLEIPTFEEMHEIWNSGRGEENKYKRPDEES